MPQPESESSGRSFLRDFSGSRRRSEEWIVAGNPGELQERLVAAAEEWGGKYTSVSKRWHEGAEIHLGSAKIYRLMGMISKPQQRPLILRANFVVAGENRTKIRVEYLSDEGFYVVNTPLARRQFSNAFDSLHRSLVKHFPPL